MFSTDTGISVHGLSKAYTIAHNQRRFIRAGERRPGPTNRFAGSIARLDAMRSIAIGVTLLKRMARRFADAI
jgi:hypothetical protein